MVKNTIIRKRIRSPSYPSLTLDVAIAKVKVLFSNEGRNEAIFSVALRHFGYSKKSGSGLKAIAALSSFGLIQTSGTGDAKRVKLSELALRILLDNRENSSEKQELIKDAALQPKIYSKLWNRWGKELPSHDNMRHTLIFDDKFNENFVDDFIKKYKHTIEFSGLKEEQEPPEEQEPTFEEEYEHETTSVIQQHTNTEQSLPYQQPAREQNDLDTSEIAKYPVGGSATISLVGKGEITQKSMEALVAQLNLAIQLGAFNTLGKS